MKKQFVPFELALKLKELGFSENVLAEYDSNKEFLFYIEMNGNTILSCKAPLWQQAFDWFREKHNLSNEISTVRPNVYRYYIASEDNTLEGYKEVGESGYIKSRLACLEKLIELVKSK